MSNAPNLRDWIIADILSRPDELFILWLLRNGLISTVEDLSSNFEDATLLQRLIDRLEKRGLLTKKASALELSETARDALRRLSPYELEVRTNQARQLTGKQPSAAAEIHHSMSREEQIAVLLQGAPIWNVWRTNHAHLLDIDLSGASLSGASLRGADLHGAILRKVNLSGATLSRADLSGASLNGADLRGATLSEADLNNADLSEANLFLASLSAANLSEANLSRANLRWAILSRAILSRADLSEADLSGASLNGADLRGTDLRGTDLRGTDLRGTDLRGTDLSGANLLKAILSDTTRAEEDRGGQVG